MKTNLAPFTLLISGLLASSCASSCATAQPVSPAPQGRIYTFQSDASGFNTQTHFFDDGREVVAFDAQFTPELARKAIAYLRTQTPHPIRTLVILHPNPDKFNGLSAFQEIGAQVIASRRTVEAMPGVHAYKKYFFVHMAHMFTDENYPPLGKVDRVFDEKLEIRTANGQLIELTELGTPGVSSNQTVAEIPTLPAVLVGDLIHSHVHAWLEGGIVDGKAKPELASWISQLKWLRNRGKAIPGARVFAGRGESSELETAVNEQIAYLRTAEQIVTGYLKDLGDRRSELVGPTAQIHYSALQAEFEKRFPHHGLGYMIGYGVYGLVNSKL